MSTYSKSLPWLVVFVLVAVVAVMWSNHSFKTAEKDLENVVLQKQLEQARLPEAQVQVSIRKAVVASGNVAAFKSTSSQVIGITAEVDRPNSGIKKTFAITLDPGQTQELGGIEGWSFVPGDMIRISQPGHKPLLVTPGKLIKYHQLARPEYRASLKIRTVRLGGASC